MSTRSLNKIMLIGNLTRDVELRYTGTGTPIATFGMATNRSWNDSEGNRQEEAEFHRVVAWSKLAEICDQLLFKGRKVFIEGRIQTRKWTGNDGEERENVEIVAENMMVLDNRTRDGGSYGSSSSSSSSSGSSSSSSDQEEIIQVNEPEKTTESAWADSSDEGMTKPSSPKKKTSKKAKKADEKKGKKEKPEEETINVDDIPF